MAKKKKEGVAVRGYPASKKKLLRNLTTGSGGGVLKPHNENENNKQKKRKWWCHQCHRPDNVFKCNNCHFTKYCLTCLTKWYPGFSLEEFAKACPVCLNICNCKNCLRQSSNQGKEAYSCSNAHRIRYSKHIIRKLSPLVNQQHLTENNITGLSLSDFPSHNAKCVDICCGNCGAYVFDLYRSCVCGYALCFVCCRDGKWKSLDTDGIVRCPPIDNGGCDNGILNLKHVMPLGYVASLLEKTRGVCESDDVPKHCTNESCLFDSSAKYVKDGDMEHFQFHWSKGEPVIVSDVLSKSLGLSWEPMVLWRAFRVKRSTKNSHAHQVNAINCLDWSEVTLRASKFFSGYSKGRSEREWRPDLILKLEGWKPSCVSQGEWPRHFAELISCLPFKDYTHPQNGYLNVAAKLSQPSFKPDMGPRMDIGYGDSVTKLHYAKSDTVNVLTHTNSAEHTSTKSNKTDMVKRNTGVQDEDLADDTMEGGALWDIFRRRDVPNLIKYLNNHLAELKHADCFAVDQVIDPIHERAYYLDMEQHKGKLRDEFGIEPWSFRQKLGDAVFIPAGCPYQVRNLKSCTKVEVNFVSPESVSECIRLQHELRMFPDNHRAKQDKLNIGKMMINALDQAVADVSKGVGDSNDDHQFGKEPEMLDGDNASHTNGWLHDTETDHNCQHTNSDKLKFIREEMQIEVISVSTCSSQSTPSFSSSSDGSQPLKSDHTTVKPPPATCEDSVVGLWREIDVGLAAKELLQVIEQCYPDTFQGVQIRSKPMWQSILKELHLLIKGFLETSMDELTEDQITKLREDFNEFENLGFNFSWAQKKLDTVQKIRFGNEPLLQEIMTLEESLKSSKQKFVEMKKRFEEAREKLEKTISEYDNVADAKNNKARELAEARKSGDGHDGQLGFNMRPGYQLS